MQLTFCIGLPNMCTTAFAGEVLKIGGTGTSIGAMKLIAAAKCETSVPAAINYPPPDRSRRRSEE